jgi:hypothetical protein
MEVVGHPSVQSKNMGWIGHLLDMLAPELAKSIRSGVSAFRGGRRRRRHRYVLVAMTTEPGRLVAPDLGSVRYDLATIDRRLYIAQMNDALGHVPLFEDEPRSLEQDEVYRAVLRRQRRLGLPPPSSPDRAQRVEEILSEMVEDNLLAFHPPNMWTVR